MEEINCCWVEDAAIKHFPINLILIKLIKLISNLITYKLCICTHMFLEYNVADMPVTVT